MYNWHPTSEQILGKLTMEPGRFLIEVCLRGQQWWEYPKNSCPQHVQEKINKKYWPKIKQEINDDEESGKEEAYRTKGSQW